VAMKKNIGKALLCACAAGLFSPLFAVGEGDTASNDSAENNKPAEIREYKYPPDYMRREPVLNYPEMIWSLHGKNIKKSKVDALKERSYLNSYWHTTDSDKPK
jgi:hypothetical protein